ncbi:hypothetical protein F5877DRAFT_93433 [Lentinula edodes]|nr:hypothetical protein F5877DRAFT_93433 [Lentinula edodes]
MLEFQSPGKKVVSYRHPEGVFVQTKAIRKTGGFLSPSANLLCSFCDCTSDDIDNLDVTSWSLHDAAEWLSIRTKSGRQDYASTTGVRWTALHRLPHWDPVKHLGVLAHQLRTLWGIGLMAEALALLTKDEEYTDAELSESADELEELQAEIAQYNVTLSQDSDHSVTFTPTPKATPYLSIFNFSDKQIIYIRGCIKDIMLPTWVDRPPVNLGEVKHGKLKAHDYLTLFTSIFPLIIPHLWWNNDEQSQEYKLFESYIHLTASTNIICSFKTSNSEAEKFSFHYTKYRESTRQLFPECHDLPNHHFAMHNEQLLKYWGPMPALSEFPGEQLNGMLQKVKTNHRIYDMAYTMLKQMCPKSPHQIHLSEVECANFLFEAPDLGPQEYVILQQYLHQIGRPFRTYTDIPHPEYSLVLPPAAKRVLNISANKYTYSCFSSHPGNSSIQFYDRFIQTLHTGFIHTILQLPLEGILQSFLLVQEHFILPLAEEQKAPYIKYPELMTRIVGAAPSNKIFVIEPQHIITHLTTMFQTKGTYGIPFETYVVCWGLNRGRK